MATKKCSGECGEIKPLSEFYAKGAECRECNKKKRRDQNREAGKIRHIDPETIEIKEKYKNDPVEMQRQLNNAKAKRARERQKNKLKSGEIQLPKIESKICNGSVCKGKLLPVENFSKQNIGDGYQSCCKECKKFDSVQKIEIYKDVDLENTYKSCKNKDCKCENPQPLTAFDKHANYEYGRNDICKACRHIERSEMNYPRQESGTKFCSKCDKKLNVSMFYSDKCQSDGLQSLCITHQKIKINKSNSNYLCAITKIFNDAKQNAKKRGINFQITKEDIEELFKKQNGKCAITEVQLTYSYMTERQEGDSHIINKTNMSIDRINNSKGYTKNNIHLICAVVNRIKHEMNLFELMFFAITVSNKISRFLIKTPITLTSEMSKRIEQKYKYCISNAKTRNLKVEISLDFLNELYVKQNGKCAITGQSLTCDKSRCDISIDRIDSNKNYTQDNVQLVLDSANILKGDLTKIELEDWSTKIKNSKLFLSSLAYF